MVKFKIRRGFGKKSSLAEKLSKLIRRRGKKRVEEIIKGIIKREPITILPLKPTYTIIETYYVYEPFAKVNIVSIPEKGGMLGYYVEEFTLTRDEQEILEKLIDILTEELEPAESIEDLKSYVAREVIRLANKYRSVFKLTGSRRAKILYYVERNLLGYGPIDPLMRDPNIEDISCDGAGKPIYVWHKKYESLPTNIIFNTTDHLNDFIMRLAHMAGKHVSIAFPILDAMLPEKHRLAATFGTEVSPRGPTFTIRKFREKPLSPTELIKSGVINELFAAYIWYMVEKRRTFMIAGGTGAGKTTLLNAFSLFIRPGMKIVTVEDTPELNLPHENWVQLSTRVSYALMGQTSG
ncbi:MAG: protein kinase, partial [Thermoprotei archaeon]